MLSLRNYNSRYNKFRLKIYVIVILFYFLPKKQCKLCFYV